MVKPSARTRAPLPQDAAQPAERRAATRGRHPVDAWMDGEFRIGRSVVVKRKAIAICILALPALAPILFVSRAIIHLDSNILTSLEADVLGTGSMALLILTLTVTPMVTLTGQHWFVPLRKWYGIVLACTAITDGVLAAITGDFAGGIAGRVAGHSFLLVGLAMVALLLPLLVISNKRAQRWLGRYWKRLQRLTYVIWGLLFLHLALLEGFGFQHGTNGPSPQDDGNPVLHQRIYQLTACSLPLVLLRLPHVRKWATRKREEGKEWVIVVTFLPLAALYILFFAFIVNEEIFKGVGAFRLQDLGG
jgi:DMSO/TMAO reductase YedYZ heme-binding membrane subunit